MAEDDSGQDKTEEPTAKRLREAQQKGQIPFSREVTNFLMLALLALNIIWLSGMYAPDAVLALRGFITRGFDMDPTGPGFKLIMVDTLKSVGFLLLLPVTGAVFVALFSSFVQNGLVISPEPIIPKLEKISVFKGISRMFSLKSFMEFIKGIIKITLVASVCWLVIAPYIPQFESFISYSVADIIHVLQMLAFQLVLAAVAVMLVIAAIDFLYQRFEYMKSLRMTRQEIKDEYKQTEGNPEIKNKLRQIRMERAQRRMMSAVPNADVIIRNPTHYAVALKYDQKTMKAPSVVAKGLDNIALKIIDTGEEHDVTVITNKPLARALYESTEIDEEIPMVHYQAVAEVISYVYRLKKGERATYKPAA